jgi:hypothetical protein
MSDYGAGGLVDQPTGGEAGKVEGPGWSRGGRRSPKW